MSQRDCPFCQDCESQSDCPLVKAFQAEINDAIMEALDSSRTPYGRELVITFDVDLSK